jgi:tyrosyl-tRNA synthetase
MNMNIKENKLDNTDLALKKIKYGTLEIINEEELKNKLIKSCSENKPLKIKLGMDPTAPHVHLGFAVVLRKLRQFQDLGHEVIIIIGDFTALIGDPTGRSATRPMLTEEEIRQNAQTYIEQYSKILDINKTKIVYNSQWLSKMNARDLIDLTSKYTVARILERDDFSKRHKQGQPIGLHEFLYPLFQGYDSVHLECDVEMGGMDQKFNILVGRELLREYGKEPQIALFMPILEGLDGVQKMSKSLGNYIGITDPPKDMFGKIMSIPDNMIVRYFQLCTDLTEEEIKAVEDKLTGGTNPRDLKMQLASEIVTIYHDREKAEFARNEFIRIFSEKKVPKEMPELRLKKEDIKEGKIWIINLLTLSGLAPSKREAKRLIIQGAVEFNGEIIKDEGFDVTPVDDAILKVGSRHFVKIKK